MTSGRSADEKGSADGKGSGGKADTRPGQAEAGGATAFPVVGIGASAGGLEPLQELLANMPVDTGMAFVIIMHQHPGHTNLLQNCSNCESYAYLPLSFPLRKAA